MDRRFLYYLFKSLRAWRFLLPLSIRRFLPRKLISIVLLILFMWFLIDKFDLTSYFHTTELPKENSSVQLYSNLPPQNLKSAYLTAIHEAKSSILILVYALHDYTIVKALREQSRRGVEITVICDAEASQNVGKQLGSDVKVHYMRGQGLMHLKLMVVDRKQVWIGSANFTGASLKSNGNLAVGINSPTIAKGIEQLADSMLNSFKTSPKMVAAQLPQQKVELWFLPAAEKTAFHRLMNLLYQAKSSLRIAMFTLTHPRLIDAIIDAHDRGVDVQVVLDREKALDPENFSYKKLLEAGVNVGLSNSSSLLHYKMALVDERTLVNGSANWTLSAFNRNHDCFLVIEPLDDSQKQEISAVWQFIESHAIFESSKVPALTHP